VELTIWKFRIVGSFFISQSRAVVAQLAVVIGIYLWKSKNENRSKHAMSLIRELAS